MRDPRNWVRPVVAVAVGTAAGAGLVVLRVRSQHRKQRKQCQGARARPAHAARRAPTRSGGSSPTLIRSPASLRKVILRWRSRTSPTRI